MTNFLDYNDLKINIISMDYVKEIKYNDDGYYAIKTNKFKGFYNVEQWFSDFIELGKMVYENKTLSKYIEPIIFRDTVQVYKYDRLILKRDIIKDEHINPIIKDWCEKNPVTLIEPNSTIDYRNGTKIEVFTLLDMAVFSYLVLSALNNYYLKKTKKEEFEKGNRILFSSFTEIEDGKLDGFYETITDIISHYEYNYSVNYRPNAKNIDDYRPLLRETTDLSFNSTSKKLELVRIFENIYSIFFLITKIQIYAFNNGNRTFNICRCGNVIIGKAKHCDSCRRVIDRERHSKKNTPTK